MRRRTHRVGGSSARPHSLGSRHEIVQQIRSAVVGLSSHRLQIAHHAIHRLGHALANLPLRTAGRDHQLQRSPQRPFSLHQQIANDARCRLPRHLGHLRKQRTERRRENDGETRVLGRHSAASIPQVQHLAQEVLHSERADPSARRNERRTRRSTESGTHRCRWLNGSTALCAPGASRPRPLARTFSARAGGARPGRPSRLPPDEGNPGSAVHASQGDDGATCACPQRSPRSSAERKPPQPGVTPVRPLDVGLVLVASHHASRFARARSPRSWNNWRPTHSGLPCDWSMRPNKPPYCASIAE